MRIRMLESMSGAANPEGSVSRLYQAGEVVDCSAQWRRDLAAVFIGMGRAERVRDVPESRAEEEAPARADAGPPARSNTGAHLDSGPEGVSSFSQPAPVSIEATLSASDESTLPAEPALSQSTAFGSGRPGRTASMPRTASGGKAKKPRAKAKARN